MKQLWRILENDSAIYNGLDPKIAEYVFFPLSHILRQIESLPIKIVELCILCVEALLRTGWQEEVPPAIGIQLLILFTYLSDDSQSKDRKYTTSEEVQSIAISCLEQLFISLSKREAGRKALIDIANVPTISHVISIVLAQARGGASVDIQLAALRALDAFIYNFPDINALATFLPGIVSSLVKILSTKAGTRRNAKVLVRAINTLSNGLAMTLSDDVVARSRSLLKGNKDRNVPFTEAWMEAASAQMKLALSNIVKLRNHDKMDVRQALLQLSKVVIESCRESLSTSRGMMLEMLATIMAGDEGGISADNNAFHLSIDDDLNDAFKDCLYDWLTSLPWTMQLKDDEAVSELLSRINYAYKVTLSHESNSQMTDHVIIANITDGISALMKADKRVQDVSGVGMQELVSIDASTEKKLDIDSFEPVLVRFTSQSKTLKSILRFLETLGRSATKIFSEVLQNVSMSQAHPDLASFWLCLNLLKLKFRETDQLGTYVQVQDLDSPDPAKKALEELYGVLVGHLISIDATNTEDWRITALTLETVALQAMESKEDFRNELIDCLYPVLHLLGSPIVRLQKHAIVTLNIIADACGYKHVSDLIVSNVDYLVNAIALKLNTFDVSPQAPQTLLMMVKLSGSRVLPYLDDLIENIFAILDCYHHYPKLVELLFSVLIGVSEVGTKVPQLTIEHSKPSKHRELQEITLSSISADLKDISARKRASQYLENLDEPNRFPRRPWKAENEKEEDKLDDAMEDSGGGALANDTEAGPPAPAIYNLLLRVARLTEHYLTSSLPSLRSNLLTLLVRVLPTLALHENSFLPLINTLWPVLRARLDDHEGYIISGALDVMSIMCEHGRDFMKGRLEDSWEDLRKLYEKIVNGPKRPSHRPLLHDKQNQDRSRSLIVNVLGTDSESKNDFDMKIEATSRTENNAIVPPTQRISKVTDVYIETSARQIWESLIRLFTTMLEYVSISEDTFDEMLDILGPAVETQSHVRAALEAYNADAVWLTLLNREKLKVKDSEVAYKMGNTPKQSNLGQKVYELSDVQELARRRPVDKHDWQFAPVLE